MSTPSVGHSCSGSCVCMEQIVSYWERERGRSTYQSIQMILDRHKQATVEREASGYANIVILEHGPLPIRFHLDEAQVVGSAIQLQLVGGARFD